MALMGRDEEKGFSLIHESNNVEQNYVNKIDTNSNKIKLRFGYRLREGEHGGPSS